MRRIIVFSLLVLASMFVLLNAQQEKLYSKTAEKAYDIYDFQEAIVLFQKRADLDFAAKRKLALSFYHLRDYDKSTELLNSIRQNQQFSSEDLFIYALSLQMSGKQSAAEKVMEDFVRLKPADNRAKAFNENKDDYAYIVKNNPAISIKNLEFNTADTDFGPSFFQNKVVFASSRDPWLLMKREYNWSRKPYLNVYAADITNNQELGKPKKFSFNQHKKWHESTVSFAKKETLLAFTQNNYKEKSSLGTTNLQIFFMNLQDGKWTNPEPFVLNSKDYSVGHPSLSEDGNTMYFASDMPGGFGGVDIYRIDRKPDGKWGKPVNAGVNVNTEADEVFPFWDEKHKTLFFSSNGRYGLGGLDIYETILLADNTYAPACNVGAPVNSNLDDFGFIATSDRTRGYFSSNRSGGKGDDDIYSYVNNDPFPKYTVQLEVTLLDRATGNVVPNAELKVNNQSYAVDANGMAALSLTSGDYVLTANAFAYKPSEPKSINIVARRRSVVKRDTIYMDMMVAEKMVLRNIYYDFDMWDILPDAAAELDKVAELMIKNPAMTIDLSSHTDSRGSARYNEKLSELRAQSAKKYLVEKGIAAVRINAKGFGESMLINQCADGVDCSPAEHRQNRRTELFIPEFGKAENVLQVLGDYSDGRSDHDESYSSRKKHGSIHSVNIK